MALAATSSASTTPAGLFGAASVGVGLRVGLQAVQISEEAAARIAEAREAAAEAARERLREARAETERLEREQALVVERSPNPDVGRSATDGAGAPGSSSDRPVEANAAPATDSASTGRGGLLDLSV